MRSNLLFFLKIYLTTLLIIGCFQLKAQILPGTYTTSWAGNSFVPASNNDFVVQGWANSMFVDTDGTIYANNYWDEAARELGIYKNGLCTGLIPNQHGHADGGAITANSTYIWATVHKGKISRFNKSDYAENGTEFLVSTSTLKGLTASTTELFVSDYTNNMIKVYSAATQGSLLRSWTVTRPGPLAMDASGNVWVLTYDANAYGPGTGACVKAYSITGTLLKTVTLGAGVQAKSITIDKTNNELLVADIGDNMQIQIYNNINGTPAFAQSFGTQGGILSGTKGLVAPLKLNVPNLVGVDAAHNIIIWSNGNNTDVDKTVDADGMGSCVESYTRAGVQNWQMLGLEFVDMGTFDPLTDGADLYTKHEHFTMDYSKPDGQQWTWKGWTLDRKKYPSDKRCANDGNHLSTTLMRRVQGKLLMYMTTMTSGGFWIYRFDAANEGETAVPCAIHDQWQNMWTDNNGNGLIDAGENPSAINIPQEELWGKNVDKAGTIWRARVTGGIYNYPILSINSFGVPVYSATSAQVVATPAPFTDLRRIEYDSDNDIMYLSGYTAALPNATNDWGNAGRVLARYNNWSTGNRTAAYTINTLPYDTTTNISAVSFAVEKDYIFVCGVVSRGQVWVYNSATGVLLGTLDPGTNVGGVAKTGWCDLRNSIAAFKKTSGEYLITVEEDGWEKVLIYRWNPGTSNSSPTVTTTTASTITSTTASSGGNVTSDGGASVTSRGVCWSTTASPTVALPTKTLDGSGTGAFTSSITGLTPGTLYYVKAYATNSVGTNYGNEVTFNTTTAGGAWIIIDDAAPGWTWSGYANDPCVTCYNGTAHSSNVVNHYAEYTFTGTDVEAFCETFSGAGSVNILIDGVSKGIFTQDVIPYGGAQKFASITGLTNATHIIRFVSTSTNWTGIDYIRYGTNPPVSGSLSGSVAINTTSTTISTVGTADWKHFRNNDNKASGTMINSISNYTVIGGTVSYYTNANRRISWTGGTPTASSTNNRNGSLVAGINNGFSFTVAAGNGTNTLYVYAGGNNSGGTLTAHLSNSSAADYVNTVALTAGQWSAAYTITYNAAQPGQTLTITWKQASGTGNVTIQAAALTGTANRMALSSAAVEPIFNNAIEIYPNPAINYFTINFQKYLKKEKAQVEIIDFSGKKVYQSGLVSNIASMQLSTGKFAKGVYVIKITVGMETVNKKLVIE